MVIGTGARYWWKTAFCLKGISKTQQRRSEGDKRNLGARAFGAVCCSGQLPEGSEQRGESAWGTSRQGDRENPNWWVHKWWTKHRTKTKQNKTKQNKTKQKKQKNKKQTNKHFFRFLLLVNLVTNRSHLVRRLSSRLSCSGICCFVSPFYDLPMLHLAGWWFVNSDYEQGWVPSSYLQREDGTEENRVVTSTKRGDKGTVTATAHLAPRNFVVGCIPQKWWKQSKLSEENVNPNIWARNGKSWVIPPVGGWNSSGPKWLDWPEANS